MCLGIPARLVAYDDEHPDLATADVQGNRYRVNLALLAEDPPQPGDWVLLHMGFAMERLTVQEAARALEGLAIAGAGEPSEVPHTRPRSPGAAASRSR